MKILRKIFDVHCFASFLILIYIHKKIIKSAADLRLTQVQPFGKSTAGLRQAQAQLAEESAAGLWPLQAQFAVESAAGLRPAICAAGDLPLSPLSISPLLHTQFQSIFVKMRTLQNNVFHGLLLRASILAHVCCRQSTLP